ncbi:Serine/threonine protein kinase [Minicystis rosea]|nr:Serine/threonine protein kinase [Minicystis rosea]
MRARLHDRYEIERPLGKGGMGTVLAARDLHTGAAVALKWLGEPGSVPGDRELARFEQEARIASALSSPHIARVHDVGRDPATSVPFLVMDLLAGEDLQSLLDRLGALHPTPALHIAKQACAGLAAAHAASVVHRDVKPSNLFLSRAEDTLVVKVLDFGIAKIRRIHPSPATTEKALTVPPLSMTKTGEMLGSPLYMAPSKSKPPAASTPAPTSTPSAPSSTPCSPAAPPTRTSALSCSSSTPSSTSPLPHWPKRHPGCPPRLPTWSTAPWPTIQPIATKTPPPC